MDEPTLPTGFRERVYRLMAILPRDKVTTYGDLAAMAGQPRAARIVGGIAHMGPVELPWHRVVNAHGGLAIGFPGGQEVQRQLLAGDDIGCTGYVVDGFITKRWHGDV